MLCSFFKKENSLKGGEYIMRILSVILVLAIVAIPALARADISLSVSAQVSSGTSVSGFTLLKCMGFNYNPGGDPFTQCTNLGTATSLNFGTLTTRLFNSSGTDIGGAGCFYGKEFFIVYLYPDAWGGKGYELKQNAASFSSAISSAIVRSAVYSDQDKYSGQSAQGVLDAQEEGWNPQLTPSVPALAKDAGLILKSKRPRIVRAEYGIPPFPAVGESRPTGWHEIALTTPAATYSGNVVITLVEFQ